MNQSRVVSEGLLRLAAVMPVATPTPVAPLPAESLESEPAQAGHPRRDHDEPLHQHLVGPADNRAILATAKELVNHAECVVACETGRGLEPRSSLPPVPPPCPKQRSATVASGQQRSPSEAPDLCHCRTASSPTMLPKLAAIS
jgi:hypothetical protein